MLIRFISLPSSVQIIAWAVFGALLTWLAYRLTRRWVPRHVVGSHSDELGIIIAVVGVFYGLIVAALLVRAITHFDAAVTVTEREAGLTAAVYRLSVDASPLLGAPVRRQLMSYLDRVTQDEWQRQGRGEAVSAGSSALGELSAELRRFTPADSRQSESLRLVQSTLVDLYDARHARLSLQDMTVPGEIWVVSLVGELLIILFALLMPLEHRGLHVFLVMALSVSISIVLAVIMIYDTPFQGDISVSSAPYVRARSFIAQGSLDY